ncbi:uncharacterized protein LOC34622807 [Cyclospora cayetanensis]|uniref:Uncharacterized protein LOC34622807 n=2 Tax=Cyclospora cayetanensis TaxID=88456 RepID=A0A6P5WDQ0_9EIME|nr:uncharacterized protein LOC34622807 [Cyclospora cayetanensis]OEH77992.1 hypothetical protein cyc_06698 [Cyclospora cayetanensis]
MGRGKGLCSKVGGHENPAVAAWAISACLLAVISTTCFLLAETMQLKKVLVPGSSLNEFGDVMFVSYASFNGLGAMHAVLCILSVIVVVLGYFFLPQFLCAACPLLLINKLACLITCCFGGYMLNAAYKHKQLQLDFVRYGGVMPTADFSTSFVMSCCPLILLLSVAALACLICLSRAATIDEDGTMVDVMLHLPVIAGCVTMAGIMILPTRIPFCVVMGSLWLVAAVIAAALIGFQKWGGLTSKFFTLALAVFYLILVVMSAICVIAQGVLFVRGRQQVINYRRTENAHRKTFFKDLSDQDFNYYKYFMLHHEGEICLAGIVISALLFVYSVMGFGFCIRAFLGGSNAITRGNSNTSSGKE